MKLVRHGEPGRERPGVVDAAGAVRDVSSTVDDWGPAQLAPAVLTSVEARDLSVLPVVGPDVRLGPPITGVPNFSAIGLNYAAHAVEIGGDAPAEPLLFS